MNKQEQNFVATVWQYYHASGRHTLPWRHTTNPYRILVSELMLQQTQVERVIPKYEAFTARWGTTAELAAAPLGAVLIAWQGLGYNRRAKYLHQAAVYITERLGGQFPATYSSLVTLPGVGPYTAGAIMAFAYNQPVPIIETNIRRVFLHHFFSQQTEVADSTLLPLIRQTLPVDNPRVWYAALMDYGSYLKKTHGNMNVRSRHYTKQSTFTGSDRQLRGQIIRLLSQSAGAVTLGVVLKDTPRSDQFRMKQQLLALLNEGLVIRAGKRYRLP